MNSSNGLFFTEMGLFVGGVSTMAVSAVASTVCLCVSAIVGIINLVSTIKNSLKDRKISKEEYERIVEQTNTTAQQIENFVDQLVEMKKENNQKDD